jgi:recombination protein RecA
MSANFAALRSHLETALAGRVAAPFNYRDRNAVPTVSTGIAEIDALTGGLPRGALTEVFGPPCSGRTSLLFSALASRTADGESCALIDGSDAFDPHSAEAAGVDLKKVLWVRCKNIDQSLRSADLLLQSGGFGFVALDLTDIAPRLVRQVPLDSWFRFRRVVEDTPTVLMLLDQESNAKTCASLVLRMDATPSCWKKTAKDAAPHCTPLSVGLLLDSFGARTELMRSRIQRAAVGSGRASFSVDRPAGETIFHTNTNWHSRSDAPATARLK